jgi:hypothetical protein
MTLGTVVGGVEGAIWQGSSHLGGKRWSLGIMSTFCLLFEEEQCLLTSPWSDLSVELFLKSQCFFYWLALFKCCSLLKSEVAITSLLHQIQQTKIFYFIQLRLISKSPACFRSVCLVFGNFYSTFGFNCMAYICYHLIIIQFTNEQFLPNRVSCQILRWRFWILL